MGRRLRSTQPMAPHAGSSLVGWLGLRCAGQLTTAWAGLAQGPAPRSFPIWVLSLGLQDHVSDIQPEETGGEE